MGPKVLALIENSIGTKLLLASRLKMLGYEITILCAPVAFRKQMETDVFDWIILDEAAIPPARRRFLDHLQRYRKEARIVWCGKAPRGTSVPIEVAFEKPLRYDEIERFFARWTSPNPRGAGNPEGAPPWMPVGRPKMLPQSAAQGRKNPPDTGGAGKTTEGDGES